MRLQTLMQSILVSIFCIGLLRLSAGTYEATSSIAANVISRGVFSMHARHALHA